MTNQEMPLTTPLKTCLSVQGLQGKGKTHFSFTAPGPIGYINFDDGWQRVRPHFPDKQIYITDIEIPSITPDMDPDAIKRLVTPVYEEFKKTYALYMGTMRTVVVDTMTNAWALARLAYLGTQSGGVKGKQYAYTAVNEDFRRLIRLRRRAVAQNLILLHREGDEWVGEAKTGRPERKGFNEIAFEVDDLLQSVIVNGEFAINVLESKTRPQITGVQLKAPGATFVDVALQIYPETLPTDWI